MFRKLGIAVVAGALGATLAATPVAAVDAAGPDTARPAAAAPATPRAGFRGDGLTEVEVSLPLGATATRDAGLPQDHTPTGGGVVALPSEPSMVLLEDVPAGTTLAVRSRNAGTWSAWTEVDVTAADGPDGRLEPRPGVGPIWIGARATHLEVAVLEGALDRVDVVGLHPDAEPGTRGVRRAGTAASAAQLAEGGFISRRAAWATGDMGWASYNEGCGTGPSTTSDLRAMVIHHTASGTRAYAQSEVASLIRGFWRYHVGTRGWCDVAYNFFVDRFGGVWEGRAGGITKAVVGGHTFGFNSNTTSAAQIGDFEAGAAPAAMTAATSRLVGWKLGVHGLDPAGSTTLTNRTGSSFRGVPNGGQVLVRRVLGHRDLGTTTCPGTNSYRTLPALRAGGKLGAHLVGVHRTFVRTAPTPEGFRRWMSIAEVSGLRTAALGLARSPEYAGLVVDDLYRRVFGREPDPEGRAYWVGVLARGTRVEDVGALFYGSEEYFRSALVIEVYVERLYENLLHRTADPEGLRYWSAKLRSGEASPVAVARSFYAAIESRRDRVARLYQAILGRAPDAHGQAHWARELLTVDDLVLAVELVLSDEFYDRSTR